MTKLQVAINNLKEACVAAAEEMAREELVKAKKEKHIWKHGDVFVTIGSEYMICYRDITRDISGISKGQLKAICLVPDEYLNGCNTHDSKDFFPGAIFLFNIKEKL